MTLPAAAGVVSAAFGHTAEAYAVYALEVAAGNA